MPFSQFFIWICLLNYENVWTNEHSECERARPPASKECLNKRQKYSNNWKVKLKIELKPKIHRHVCVVMSVCVRVMGVCVAKMLSLCFMKIFDIFHFFAFQSEWKFPSNFCISTHNWAYKMEAGYDITMERNGGGGSKRLSWVYISEILHFTYQKCMSLCERVCVRAIIV